LQSFILPLAATPAALSYASKKGSIISSIKSPTRIDQTVQKQSSSSLVASKITSPSHSRTVSKKDPARQPEVAFVTFLVELLHIENETEELKYELSKRDDCYLMELFHVIDTHERGTITTSEMVDFLRTDLKLIIN
jgi:hypothetical protein